MDPAAQGLHELLFERLTADDSLTDETRFLVLAAFEGDAELAARLRGEHHDGPADEPTPEAVPQGHYLHSISVTGFRGIAGEQRLELPPGAGLTLITGRNGSGKSSFAEAAEIALTGENERWRDKTAEWGKGFRNLHHEGPVRAVVQLINEGTPAMRTVTRTWETDDLRASTATTQHSGRKQIPYCPDEWGHLLQTHRPFLSYSELGKLIDGRPSDLHRALFALLGLERLTAAIERINGLDADARAFQRDQEAERKQLQVDCESTEDERARECAGLLAGVPLDLTALGELACRTDDSGDLATYQAVSGLDVVNADEVERSANRLLGAVDAVDRLRTAEATAARSAATLLRAGLEHHENHGDGPCPLCGQGNLDGWWRDSAERAAAEHEELADAVGHAERERADARRAADLLISPVPEVLRSEEGAVRQAHESWQRFVDLAEFSDAELALELPSRHQNLVRELAELRSAAKDELARRNTVWLPLASRLRTWHARACESERTAPQRKQISAAKSWLKRQADTLRNERLRPFADRTQQIWAALRQQSNISLDDLRLTGSGKQLGVQLEVSVDDTDSAALSVMSQGELHSLALALFLPRATAPESPFRFLVIDDPVQAMDPAKVDGLAKILSDIARDRQVVVFTHDDRLTETVRRLRLPATVLEVCRRERSEVTLRNVQDPVTRYLSDANAVTKDSKLPEDVRSELVSGLCRFALEAAAGSAIRARRLGNGETHADVEALLDRAKETRARVSLALFDDSTKPAAQVYDRLHRDAGSYAAKTLSDCNRGTHRGHTGDLLALIRDARRLAAWLQAR